MGIDHQLTQGGEYTQSDESIPITRKEQTSN